MEYYGPLAIALALPAAHNYYFREAPTAITDSTESKIMKTLMAGMDLYTQQTWMSGFGQFINLARGDTQDYSLPQNLAFTLGQFKPFSGLQSSIARMVDPIYRKSKGFGQAFIRDVPFASKLLPEYTNPTGEPSRRMGINNILPYQIGKVDPTFERGYQNRSTQLQYNRVVSQGDDIKAQIKALYLQGKNQEADAMLQANLPVLQKSMMTNKVNTSIQRLQAKRKKITDSTLSPADKRELINLIDSRLAELIKQTSSLVK
jgi:hypothetical protein